MFHNDATILIWKATYWIFSPSRRPKAIKPSKSDDAMNTRYNKYNALQMH